MKTKKRIKGIFAIFARRQISDMTNAMFPSTWTIVLIYVKVLQRTMYFADFHLQGLTSKKRWKKVAKVALSPFLVYSDFDLQSHLLFFWPFLCPIFYTYTSLPSLLGRICRPSELFSWMNDFRKVNQKDTQFCKMSCFHEWLLVHEEPFRKVNQEETYTTSGPP